MTRKGGMLRQRPLDADVYTLAKTRCVNLFRQFDNVFVSFSGGKDSTATLMVALETLHDHPDLAARHLPLRTVFYDEEAIPQETADYVQRVGERDDVTLEWYCLPMKHRNACSRKSPYWWPWAPEAEDLWCRPLPGQALTELDGFTVDPPSARQSAPELNGAVSRLSGPGNTVMLMGIRAQESLTRRRAVTRRDNGENYLIKFPDGGPELWKGYPIYDWTTEDVWTAPAKLGWDYNRAYDRMEMAGLSHATQRCSPAFGEEPLQKIHTYAACFPEVWDKMVYRVPGVGSAARYALTELYSYHGRPDKPAGMTWQAFLLHYLAKFDPKERASVAARIAGELKFHYRKTHQPLVVHAPHPDTGVSWDWLLMLAMRGDFKGRKQPGGRIQTVNDGTGRAQPKHWHAYVRELASIIEDGTFTELAFPGRTPTDLDAIIPDYAREQTA